MPVYPVHEYETYGLVNAYSKEYPSFTRLITYDSSIKVRTSGYELRLEEPNRIRVGSANPLALIDSIRRTKKEIADITLCNNFELFATFTFAADRQNVDKCKSKMSKWLKNQRELHGKFSYLIVPEFHKDGKSLHYHALLKNYKGKLNFSGVTQNNKKVYHIKSYRLGFTNVTHIQDINKVAHYIRKYVTKDMPKFPGKKRYWCSTGLTRPIVTTNPSIDPFTLKQFVEVYRHKQLAILHLNGTLPKPTTNNEELNKWRK